MRQATGIAGIAGKSHNISLHKWLLDGYLNAVERQVRIQRDGAIIMLDGDKVGLIGVAIRCAVLGMLHYSCPCSRYDGTDGHDEVIAKQPEIGVTESLSSYPG